MNAFIIGSKAEPLTIKTARPPDPPSNLGVITTTCSGIRLAWDSPREHGVEVIGMFNLSTCNNFDKYLVILKSLFANSKWCMVYLMVR